MEVKGIAKEQKTPLVICPLFSCFFNWFMPSVYYTPLYIGGCVNKPMDIWHRFTLVYIGLKSSVNQ
jgi:hypothetical protein